MPATDETTRTVRLAGGDLDYILRRSARSRRMRVTIDGRRGVVVSVPSSSRRGWARPDPAVERFLRDREAWIRGHLVRRDRERAALVARGGLADGSAFRYRGVLHALSVTDSDGGPTIVERIGDDDVDAIVVRLGPRDSDRLSAVLRDWLKRRARAAIAHEIDRHREPLGVPGPTAIAIRDPRSRWASASRDGRLMFSWRLVLAPPEALETVVIHELAHLRVFGHGPAFWELVAARRPDHAEWRRWLRRHSYELHHALDDAGDGASLGVG